MLKLKNINENSAIYDYFPEDKQDYGTVEIDLKTSEVRMIKRAEEYSQSMYLIHAYQGLRKMKEENNFSEFRVVAWY